MKPADSPETLLADGAPVAGRCPVSVKQRLQRAGFEQEATRPLLTRGVMEATQPACSCHTGAEAHAEAGPPRTKPDDWNTDKVGSWGILCPIQGCGFRADKHAKGSLAAHWEEIHLPFFWIPSRACAGCGKQAGTSNALLQQHSWKADCEHSTCGSRNATPVVDLECEGCTARWAEAMITWLRQFASLVGISNTEGSAANTLLCSIAQRVSGNWIREKAPDHCYRSVTQFGRHLALSDKTALYIRAECMIELARTATDEQGNRREVTWVDMHRLLYAVALPRHE